MLKSPITPGVVWIGMIAQAAILIVIFASILVGKDATHNNWSLYFPVFTECVGYLIATVANFKISTEYKTNPMMRWAWIFLGLNTMVSIGRSIVEMPLWNLISPGYNNSPAQVFHHQAVILVANIFLLLGLSLIGIAFKSSGLGFSIGRRGVTEVIFIGLLTVLLLSTVSDPFPIGLVILSIAAAASVVVHKMALQMGGGKLATALRFLTLYTLMRATLVLIEHYLGLNDINRRQNIDLLMSIELVVWRLIPWIAALAAAYRVDLTVHATRELKRQQSMEAVGSTT